MTTITAGEPVSNIFVSTTCNSVNENNVKPSATLYTFVRKRAINSVNFNNVVNKFNAAEILCSKTNPSNDPKNEPLYSNLLIFFFNFQVLDRSDSVFINYTSGFTTSKYIPPRYFTLLQD